MAQKERGKASCQTWSSVSYVAMDTHADILNLDTHAGWLLSYICPSPGELEPFSINWNFSSCLLLGCSWVILSFGCVASSRLDVSLSEFLRQQPNPNPTLLTKHP